MISEDDQDISEVTRNEILNNDDPTPIGQPIKNTVNVRYQGTITTWKDGKGFGFITPNGGGNQVFVHVKSFSNRQRRPVGNEIVSYELGTDTKGRARARRVTFSDESLPSTYSPAYIGLLMLAAAFLFFICAITLAGMLPLANARHNGKKLRRPRIPQSVWKKAIELRERGLSNRAIGKELRIVESTVRYWKKADVHSLVHHEKTREFPSGLNQQLIRPQSSAAKRSAMHSRSLHVRIRRRP